MHTGRTAGLGVYFEGTADRICCWTRYKIRATALGVNSRSLVWGMSTLGFLLDVQLDQAIGYLSLELEERLRLEIKMWKVSAYASGPQPFWHQGLISWKTVCPRGWGGGK